MDTVPYDFIDKVLTLKDDATLTSIQNDFASPLWIEVARTHLENYEKFSFTIKVGERCAVFDIEVSMDLAKYIATRAPGVPRRGDHFTLEQFMQLDQRYIRTASLKIHFDDDADTSPDAVARSEMVKFVCRYHWTSIGFNNSRKTDISTERRIAFQDELVNGGFSTRAVLLSSIPGTERFLQPQLRQPDLRNVCLVGDFPDDLIPDMEAFVLRPQFKYFQSYGKAYFGLEFIKKIIAYWRAMPEPWTDTEIRIPVTENLHDGLKTMITNFRDLGNDTEVYGRQFREEKGKAALRIDAFYDGEFNMFFTSANE